MDTLKYCPSSTFLSNTSLRFLKAKCCVREDRLKANKGAELSLVFSVSPGYYSRSLLASWPSCTQRIKEGRDFWQNTRQPHSALARILLFFYIYMRWRVWTRAHTGYKVCIKTSTDVHKTDKTYTSSERSDFKSSQNLAPIWHASAVFFFSSV